MSKRYYVKAKVRLFTPDGEYVEQSDNFSLGEHGIRPVDIEEWKKCDFIAVLGQDGEDGADPELTAAQAAKIDELTAKLAELEQGQQDTVEEVKAEALKLPNGLFDYDPADLEDMDLDELNILIADKVAPYNVEPKTYKSKSAAVKYLTADFKG